MVTINPVTVMRLMRQRHLQHYELAKRADITPATLLRVLEGRTPATIMTAFKLSEALGVSHNDLIIEKKAR